jgi:hypothetical protein
MSNENILTFAELPLIPEATQLQNELSRLQTDFEAETTALLVMLGNKSVDLNILIKKLSRKKHTDHLSTLSDRLQTGIRAAANREKNPSIDSELALANLVADIVAIRDAVDR